MGGERTVRKGRVGEGLVLVQTDGTLDCNSVLAFLDPISSFSTATGEYVQTTIPDYRGAAEALGRLGVWQRRAGCISCRRDAAACLSN